MLATSDRLHNMNQLTSLWCLKDDCTVYIFAIARYKTKCSKHQAYSSAGLSLSPAHFLPPPTTLAAQDINSEALHYAYTEVTFHGEHLKLQLSKWPMGCCIPQGCGTHSEGWEIEVSSNKTPPKAGQYLCRGSALSNSSPWTAGDPQKGWGAVKNIYTQLCILISPPPLMMGIRAIWLLNRLIRPRLGPIIFIIQQIKGLFSVAWPGDRFSLSIVLTMRLVPNDLFFLNASYICSAL